MICVVQSVFDAVTGIAVIGIDVALRAIFADREARQDRAVRAQLRHPARSSGTVSIGCAFATSLIRDETVGLCARRGAVVCG